MKTRGKFLLVTGGRDFNDSEYVNLILSQHNIRAIVHGGASGADSCAETFALKNRIPSIVVFPQWCNFDQKAGPIRNSWMIELLPIDFVVAFPGNRGTSDMINKSVTRLGKDNVEIYSIIDYQQWLRKNKHE